MAVRANITSEDHLISGQIISLAVCFARLVVFGNLVSIFGHQFVIRTKVNIFILIILPVGSSLLLTTSSTSRHKSYFCESFALKLSLTGIEEYFNERLESTQNGQTLFGH